MSVYARRNSLLKAAADGVSIEGVSTQPASAFSVGDTVQTTRRKQPGVNQPGGVGTVTKVTFVKGGDALYDVKYHDSARAESSLTKDIMKLYTFTECRPQRSSAAVSTGKY